tara:strand:- start:651 stop:854 length:204 start_codon:yes stop_codon:yes gene_type:complete
MKSEDIEQLLDHVAYKVVWENEKPIEFVSDYVHNTMLADDWDPFEMLKFELMAKAARKTHGFDLPIE